ncbi:organic hydroperoxide reductase OsmC/OhrA [Variovorax paradoxus]|uniref:Organic hydroperoxide reductase OsmC/OhrA n=1 Tax=Variovorax paradoxus TaxID=34073 RepID=A0AAW8EH05_VARPD|nr:OsmC family protein [Variovorax paradoxus]MDP9972071.1 organic hydroperoxide reductase OsmC/OhrA [Variovorax paradoxus]
MKTPTTLEPTGHITLVLRDAYRFAVDFGTPGAAALLTDVKPPLGTGAGPDSEQLLVAAVANCLSSSLLFSLRKFRNEAVPMRTTADATLSRNAQGRLRVAGIEVAIRLGVAAATLRQLDRALAQFEDFCVVTQSLRAAIPVEVRVFDDSGALLTT